ncbi:MAG TPA: hypothetical protein VHW90_15005 [Stellaceae bacterium]|nr:hypothetical protein [Stellaceae bacterium]
MRVNEATELAKKFVRDAFANEPVNELNLEAFTFDDHLGIWTMTIGFLRATAAEREFKIVGISNIDKTMLSMRNR